MYKNNMKDIGKFLSFHFDAGVTCRIEATSIAGGLHFKKEVSRFDSGVFTYALSYKKNCYSRNDHFS